MLAMAVSMVTTQEISLIIWSFKGPKLFCVMWNLLEMKRSDRYHIMMLFLNWIEFRIWVGNLIGQLIWKFGHLRLVPIAHYAGIRGLNLLPAIRPVELALSCNPRVQRWQGISSTTQRESLSSISLLMQLCRTNRRQIRQRKTNFKNSL